jgi:hypothetical protein
MAGAASMQITFIRETITVRHGQTNEVLYSRPATKEDWIRIWDAIKHEEVTYTDFITIEPIDNEQN